MVNEVKPLLAIDASTEVCSVCISVDHKTYVLTSDQPRSHAQVLLPYVDQLLNDHNLQLHDLEAIAVCNGPGSFTGIRICLSVAQGLAYGANLPLVLSSSLHTMAAQVVDNGEILTALDARMGEVYWATYYREGNRLEQKDAPRLSSYQDFNRHIDPAAHCVGNIWHIPDIKLHSHQSVQRLLPSAEHLATLINLQEKVDEASMAELGLKLVTNVLDLEPLYIRNEVAWDKRKKIRQSM